MSTWPEIDAGDVVHFRVRVEADIQIKNKKEECGTLTGGGGRCPNSRNLAVQALNAANVPNICCDLSSRPSCQKGDEVSYSLCLTGVLASGWW